MPLKKKPLQNRVNPWGQLQAVPERGAWLGNRGILHDGKQIVKPWQHQNWVTCRLQYGDVRRSVFSSSSYSELFFLDEATAFAAGHRPCAFCRRDRYNDFKSAWCAANPDLGPAVSVSFKQIDRQLHAERALSDSGKVTFQKVTFEAQFKRVPDGTMIELEEGLEKQAFLIWQGCLHLWSFSGYQPSRILPESSERVTVLTPASIVQMFRQGFEPQVHESAY